MWSLVVSALSGLPGLLGDYFKRKQEIQKIEAETDKLVALKKQDLAAIIAKADVERATAALKATGAWFKYIVFWLIASPFVACLIGFPEYAAQVFENLKALPEWYLIIFTGIVAVIWGIPVQGSIMGHIWDGIKTSVANRRQYKLDKTVAKNTKIEKQDPVPVVLWEDDEDDGKTVS